MNKTVQLLLLAALGIALIFAWFRGGSTGPVIDSTATDVESPAARHVVPDTATARDVAPSTETSWESLEQAAESGDKLARSKMCAKWLDVGAVVRDYKGAVRWCELAARSGDAQSQTTLGQLYQLGKGVPADSQQAAQWYEKAAQQGDEQAVYLLGRMLTRSGDPADQALGTALLQQAAAKGHANARRELQELGIEEQPRRDQSLLTQPTP